MGLKDAIGSLRRKADIPNPSKPSLAGLTSAIVTQVEDQVAEFRDLAGYKDLAPLVKGLALDLAMFNAKCLASVPLRLWMPEKSAVRMGVKHARPDFRTGRHLRDHQRVGAKAVIRAQQAGDVVEVIDHPALDVLRRPSPDSTGMSWDLLRWVNKQMYGDAMMLVIPGKDSPVVAMPNLRPNWTRVQPDKERGIAGWYYGCDPTDYMRYDEKDVLVMPWSDHPHRKYRGLGWLELAERELAIEDFALASELSRWRNGGYPEGLLAFKDAKDQKQLDSAVDSFYKQLLRSRRRGGVVATGESTYTPLSIAEEMNYIPGMELVERRIMNRAGVPEALYKLNDANLASSYSADPAYAKRTIMPALTVDAEQWTELLLPRFGTDPDSMWFAYDTVGDTDLAALRQDVVYVNSGIRTINEHRALLGDDPSDEPNADKLMVNGQPLGQAAMVPPEPFGFSPVVNVNQPGPMLAEAGARERAEVVAEPEDAAPAKAATSPLMGRKAWTPDDPYVCAEGCACCSGDIETKDDDRLDIDAQSVTRIQSVIRDWMLASSARVAAGEFDLSGFDADLAADLEPLVAELFRVGAGQGYAQLGTADSDIFEIVPQDALDAVRRHNSLIVEQIRGTTENGIRAGIERAIGEGMSATEARDAVAESMGEAADWRSERIARTEAAEANVAGSQAAWLQAGYEANTMLLAPGACSICRAVFAKINGRADAVGKSSGLESKAVPITVPLVKAGETIVGDDGRKMTFRIDRYRTPIHPNDRCAMNPYIPGDEGEE